MEAERPLPRGGKRAASALELRAARAAAERDVARALEAGGADGEDFLADGGGDKEARRAAKRARRDGGKGDKGLTAEQAEMRAIDAEAAAFAEGVVSAAAPARAAMLRAADLRAHGGGGGTLGNGTRLLGVVVAVGGDRDVTVALPHGLRGFAAAVDAAGAGAPPLTELFAPGDLVCAAVKSADASKGAKGGRRVALGLLPAFCNGAATGGAGGGGGALSRAAPPKGASLVGVVASEEDHGFSVDLGDRLLQGFLKRKAAPAGLRVGAPLRVTVARGAKKGARVVELAALAAAHGADEAERAAEEYAGVTLQALQPGDLVEATVKAVLPDGLHVGFMTYFSGTVDRFHIGEGEHRKGDTVTARVLFIDPLKKTVGLTLRKELVSWGARGTGRVELGDLPRPGALFAEARVARVDPGMGLLLDLGAGEDGADARAPGYVHVSNCSDKHIDKLEKAFSVGQRVKARVLAQRAADGLASLSLREGVVSQALLSVRDCAAGMAVEGTVEAVQERGVVVRVTDSITGFCPLLHTSDAPNETGAASRARKFPEGKRMSWRVLVSDAATNKLVLTARRSLMGDAVEALVSLEGAVVGTRYAGVVANVQPFGVFVEFFGGVRGLAHRSQLGLLPSQEPAEVFERGAPVRAEVTGVDFDKRQLSISLSTTKRSAVAASEAASGLEDFEVGDIVDATVRAPLSRSAAATIALDVRHEGATDGDASVARATLSCAHACDVEEISAPALELLRAGDALGAPCVVLASDPARGVLRVSAKASLVGAARRGELPASGEELAALSEGTVLDAYVASVTPTAVFVRCGERTTGYVKSSRALAQGDVRMSERLELTEAYARDQSVLVRVIEAEADTNRFSGSLLRAAVAEAAPSRAATALASGVAWARRSQALALREKEEATRGAAAGGTKVTLSECCNLEERYCARFPLGKAFSGEVLDELDYGVVVKIAAAKEVLFFLGADATGGEGVPDKGKTVDVRVIDANVADGIVDVTCAKAAMPTKKSKKVASVPIGEELEATVVVARTHYLVLRLPGAGAPLAWAAPAHPNETHYAKAHAPGDAVRCVVTEAASSSNGHRALAVLLHDVKDAAKADSSAKRAAAMALVSAGNILTATVVSVESAWAQLTVKTAKGDVSARLHVTELSPPTVKPKERKAAWYAPGAHASPLASLKKGDELSVKAVGASKAGEVLVSARAASADGARAPSSVTAGDLVHGYVDAVDEVGYAMVSLSPTLRGRLAAVDAFDLADPAAAANVKDVGEGLTEGMHVLCRVLAATDGRRRVDLTLNLSSKAAGASARSAELDLSEGDVVRGRVGRVLPGAGLLVQLGASATGRVHITEIGDTFVPEPLAAFEVGDVVTAAVTRVGAAAGKSKKRGISNSGTGDDKSSPVDLSLRHSLGGSGAAAGKDVAGALASEARLTEATDVSAGDLLPGYVKATTSKGCFVSLGAHLEARCVLKNLADAFVSKPDEAFPPGALVRCKVLSVNAQMARVEVSLKPSHTQSAGVVDPSARPERPTQESIGEALAALKEGQRVQGAVRRVEDYGAFVRLDAAEDGGRALLSGLVHVSALAECKVESVAALLAPGDRVECDVVAVDLERKRLSLAMTPAEKKRLTAKAKALAKKQGTKGTPGDGGDAMDSDDGDSDSDGEELDAMETDARVAAMLEADGEDESEDEAGGAEFEQAAFDGEEEGESEDEGDEEGSDEDESEDDSDDDESDDDLEAMEEDGAAAGGALGARMAAVAPLDVDMGGGDGHGDDDSDADDAGEEGAGEPAEDEAERRGRRRKAKAAAAKEAELRRAEAARVAGAESPASAEDFERLLLASPGSAYTWVKYMALHLATGDAPAARKVAGRALDAIPWRNEADKLAVWTAWLNLENLHGEPDPEEATAALFAKACARTDAKKLHVVLLDIYERSADDRTAAADKLVQGMCRSFKTSCKIWLRAIEHFLRSGKGSKARATLDRALQSLPRRKHIKAITAASLLEFRHGSAERARVMLEGVLKSYPKRTDIMSVYIDAEIKHGDGKESVRALFERATRSEHLSARQAKFLFKRYLEYERKEGDEAGVEHVKACAMEWTSRNM